MEETTASAQQRQPKNIFEQILFGVQAVNENIIAISEENAAQRAIIEELLRAFVMPPVPMDKSNTEPGAPGAETEE